MNSTTRRPLNSASANAAAPSQEQGEPRRLSDLVSLLTDAEGFYGQFGGRYVPEVLIPALDELNACFEHALKDPAFLEELSAAYTNYVGRPTPLYYCENLSRKLNGGKIFVKNEGLAHTGAHKINHCIGQVLLAKRMNKPRIVAETGAGQHGLATATVSARYGLECVIYMGAIDYRRQRPNVYWMEQLGAKVHPVEEGGKRLKDAVNAAIKDWITNVSNTHYLLGSCLGPHPFPEINRVFQAVVGREIRQQCIAQTGKLPDIVIACVGGGSNSLGAFSEFLNQPHVRLIGVEAGGKGSGCGQHAARFPTGRIGIVEGYKSYWLLDGDGQTFSTHSISAGLDYAGIGPLHAFLHDSKRVSYVSASDDDALNAVKLLMHSEGIISALESSHALAEAIRIAPSLSKDSVVVVNLSGRGDKDLFIFASATEDKDFFAFLSRYLEEHSPPQSRS